MPAFMGSLVSNGISSSSEGGFIMARIKIVLDAIENFVKIVIGILLGIMLLVALTEVFRRYFLGRSFSWSEELVRYLIIWISFLGAAVAFKDQSLVYFDMIVSRIFKKEKLVLSLVTNTIILIFIGYIFSNSIQTILKPSILNQKSVGLQVPMIIPFLSVPVGLGLMFIFGLYHYKTLLDLYNHGQFEKEGGHQ